MKICLVNFDTSWKDKKKNISAKEKHIQKILEIEPGTQVIVFPELSCTGFVLDGENENLAEKTNGFCLSEIKNLSKKYKVNIIGGFIEKNNSDKPYNSAFVIDKKGNLKSVYRKNHLFSQGKESEFYSAGENLSIFELNGLKCGIFTCFDIRFPRLFESYSNKNIDICFGIFNWVEDENKKEIFLFLNKTRAVENQFFVASVDRYGKDPNFKYTGSAIISDPLGNDISILKEEIYHFAEIDKNKIQEVSKKIPIKPFRKDSYNF